VRANKKAGVSYAVTNDGLELPVVDVTHPAFAAELSPEKQQALLGQFWRSSAASRPAQAGAKRAHAVFHARLAHRPGFAPRGGHVLGPGMTTYLFKLGPQNLGSYAGAGRSPHF